MKEPTFGVVSILTLQSTRYAHGAYREIREYVCDEIERLGINAGYAIPPRQDNTIRRELRKLKAAGLVDWKHEMVTEVRITERGEKVLTDLGQQWHKWPIHIKASEFLTRFA